MPLIVTLLATILNGRYFVIRGNEKTPLWLRELVVVTETVENSDVISGGLKCASSAAEKGIYKKKYNVRISGS